MSKYLALSPTLKHTCTPHAHTHGHMACGRVENCSDQPSLAPVFLSQIQHLSELDQFLDYNSNKKRFSWNGNANDLGKFIEDRILSHDEDEDDAPELVISSNSQCAVFKTSLATFNFYYSTKTLHVQGKACSEMRNRLLDVFNLRTNSFQRRQENGREPCASLNRRNSADEICILTDLNNNEGAQHNHSAALVMPDEHSESQSINRISRNQSEPSSSRFVDDANSSCQNGQNTQGCTGCQSLRGELQRIKAELADSKQRISSSDTELDKTDSPSENCDYRNEIHKLWIAVESINSQLKSPAKQTSTIERELNQYKLKCATYKDKIKKMEEEKVCLLQSLRILSTESSACSKVSIEYAVNNQQEINYNEWKS